MKMSYWSVLLTLVLVAGCAHHAKVEEPADEAESKMPYTKPLSTPGTKFGSMPQSVQNTVRSEAGTAEINDVRKEVINGRVVYTISFKDSDSFPPMLVGADGSVLNPDLSVAMQAPRETGLVKFSDLPLTVSKTIVEHVPETEISSIRRETWGDHIVYIVVFKDEVRYPKMQVVSDGSLLLQAH